MKRTGILTGFALLVTAVLVCGCTMPFAAQSPATPTATATTGALASPAPEPGFYGNWVLTIMTIQEGGVPLRPSTEITLTINNDGSLTGYGGCNNYFASYTLPGTITKFGNGIAINPIASTKKYCEINGQQETTYLVILQRTIAYSVNVDQLSLTDRSNNVLVYKTPSALAKTT
jgi:heat shock protein HslJ